MNAAKTFAINLGQAMVKVTMHQFFNQIHFLFYPKHDISFMEYFLELTKHEDEFVVHHDKLIEYGIMTSFESSDVEKKLAQLGLIESQDYQCGHTINKVYLLTPDAFKKSLMRAQRLPNHSVDPIIYCNHYLILEKIVKLYSDYKHAYSTKLISVKNDAIDELMFRSFIRSAKFRSYPDETRKVERVSNQCNQ